MKPNKRCISSLSRTKKKDQSLKKLLIWQKISLKILFVIHLLSSAAAVDSGMVPKIPHEII